MNANGEYLYRLVGWMPDGKRVNCRYKNYDTARKRAKQMEYVNIICLQSVTLQAFEADLLRQNTVAGNA